MRLTEGDARKRWCPHARLPAGYQSDGANRSAGEPVPEWKAGTLCVASACMFWRWASVKDMRAYHGSAAVGRRGYCGSAGIPQPEESPDVRDL